MAPKNKRGNHGGNNNGGNGGGGGGQGGAGGDDDDDGGSALSDEQRDEITNLVNAAVSGQLSRKLPNAITSALEAGLAPLREQIAGIGTRRGDDGSDDDDDDQPTRGKGKSKGAAPAKDPEVEQMRKRLASLEEERKTEREQARNRERDGMLREQLEAAGVDKNRIRGAIAVLRDSLKYDDKTGEWTYKAKRDGYDDDLDVSDGVAEWAATDEGKAYLAPPSGAGGGGPAPRGGSGVRPAGPGGTPKLGAGGGRPVADPKAAKVAAKQDAMKNLSTAIDSLAGGTIPLG